MNPNLIESIFNLITSSVNLKFDYDQLNFASVKSPLVCYVFFLTLISYTVSMVHLSSHLMFLIKYAFSIRHVVNSNV
jgi:hypothetical protein